ncbi:SGNH/GDSL hydrolase family protein [Nocardia huaxiensis]|uniref:SGNH/GDSL hydrolase family protein n=1 Tax=Nocardia huaxiensis TaxID=2755382 RepID=A0A7D6VF54_9NOCA|nr:SGNH/GDSL hydrolase family protein [Nocardia huaxiensis]QLY33022.1 SGNH/GDSL hydrolase family protein [Nocardia huaxiensis]UFS93215.1 SGNH/GDSL hydrolase family protein [Nocardia huaxiensis]
MRISRVVAAVVGASGILATALLPVAHADPDDAGTGFNEYVALGDSWAADATLSQITTVFTPAQCVQSARNYAKQVAATLNIPVFRDATCGGATTKHMTAPQTGTLGTNAPQFDRLTETTDLVTLEIGGNDAELAATVMTCVTLDPAATPCRDRMVVDGEDRMSRNLAATANRVIATIAGIRERAPQARILLLDYFQGVDLDGGCFPEIPISDGDAIWLGHKLLELHQTLAWVAETTGVDFVNTYDGSAGHDACQPVGTRWVEGLLPFSGNPIGLAVPFHPNQLGADYQARRVLETLGAR